MGPTIYNGYLIYNSVLSLRTFSTGPECWGLPHLHTSSTLPDTKVSEMPKPCNVRFLDCLLAFNCFHNKQQVYLSHTNWKVPQGMQLCPYIKHDTRSDGPYHLHRAECRDDPGALTSWNPNSNIRLVAENLYLFTRSDDIWARRSQLPKGITCWSVVRILCPTTLSRVARGVFTNTWYLYTIHNNTVFTESLVAQRKIALVLPTTE